MPRYVNASQSGSSFNIMPMVLSKQQSRPQTSVREFVILSVDRK